MDENKWEILRLRIEKTMEQLRKNRMEAYYAENKGQALHLVEELLNEGDVVTNGGSVTLTECGVIDLLRSGKYRYLDRAAPGTTPDAVREIYLQAFRADAYLMSANAVTENGELYNVDGNSNRVAALLYGPKSVIVVAGYNKLVRNVEEAIARVKQTAAPANAARLHCGTPCTHTGVCQSDAVGGGCRSEKRICANYVLSSYQREPGRIKVILVGEELGY
jgi:L-lactate utilization protein LutB